LRGVRTAAAALAATVLVAGVCGCQTLAFYGQAVAGHTRLMRAREPVDAVREDPATPAARKARLALVEDALTFARDRLALPVGERYRTYVEWPDRAVVWNVFATGELSVEPHTWCYPIVGCAAYRGYFRRPAADAEAARRARRGDDVRVDGAAAYSTLGWFDDPLLSTFIDWPEPELAGLLFHELAHGRAFAKGDTEFNESYATFVEREAVRAWLEARGDATALADYRVRRDRNDRRARFMLAWREALRRVYEAPYDDFAQRMMKADMMAMARRCEQDLGIGATRLPADLNNADFVPWAAYRRAVPAFAVLFAENGGDWVRFHAAVESLALAPKGERRTAIDAALARAPADERDESIACQVIAPAVVGHVTP
jgi:predicted aminopeptidase